MNEKNTPTAQISEKNMKDVRIVSISKLVSTSLNEAEPILEAMMSVTAAMLAVWPRDRIVAKIDEATP